MKPPDTILELVEQGTRPAETIEQIPRDSGAAHVVSTEALDGAVAEVLPRTPSPRAVIGIGGALAEARAAVRPGDLATPYR